ncbi:hypothetical protein PsYK624_166500 [Phanerochaete sordida]|uniref:Uncharacterized protein n=1 Tax=Phanerochaete sordida TaxID=48140 RepID=A0A9P3LM24_9APHY|nr:hypothetical protein PsYK624_166500 [Phanerochaete sordida]
MKKTCEDVHELATLCSLRTASSETLRLDAVPKDAPEKDSTAPRSHDELTGRPPEVLFALTRTDAYGPETRNMAMRLLQREMEFGQSKNTIARSLIALSPEGIQEFFKRWTYEDGTRYDTSFHVTLRTTAQEPTAFWSTLITAMAEAHATLDRPRALALIRPFNLPPLALLFPAKHDGTDPAKFVVYACKTYADRLPHARAHDAHPPASDRALEVFAAYFAALPDPAPLGALLDRLVAGLAPRAPPRGRRRRARAPLLPHPASPHLLFALRLAAWSAAARRGLVARGVVRAVERLYGAEETEVETARGRRGVSAVSQHVMLALCFALLGALGDCYDAARSTLVEELREEIAGYSREMSPRFFVPSQVSEMRDD